MSAPYYTPQRYFPSPQTSSSSRPGAGGTSASATATTASGFTPAMRDRQARGKDPYSPHDSPSDSDLDFDAVDSPSGARGGGVGRLGHLGGGAAAPAGNAGAADCETYEERRRKLWAVSVLEDPELLATYACSRGDSIPGTRLYFTRMICGFDEEPAPQADHRKASSSRREPRRRERIGRH